MACETTLIAFASSSTTNLATSKGCEVSDNDIHALKSICGHLADKGSAFHIVLRAVTVRSTLKSQKKLEVGGTDYSACNQCVH